MESYHWFILGIMVALTPSLLVLGVLLAGSTEQSAGTANLESEPYEAAPTGMSSTVAPDRG